AGPSGRRRAEQLRPGDLLLLLRGLLRVHVLLLLRAGRQRGPARDVPPARPGPGRRRRRRPPERPAEAGRDRGERPGPRRQGGRTQHQDHRLRVVSREPAGGSARPPARRARVLWLIKGLGPGGAERLLVAAAPFVDRERFEVEACYLLPWKNHLVG